MNQLKLIELLDRINVCENVCLMAETALVKIFNNGYNKTQIIEKQTELREIIKLARAECVLIRTEFKCI